jgi:hypothetical protein
MIWAMHLAGALLSVADPYPQTAQPATGEAVALPFPSFGDRTEVSIDFWCRYEDDGRPECEATARDGFVLPDDAGDWIETRTAPRPDLAATGLRRRTPLRFSPGALQPTLVQDGERRWGFWWPELEQPVWEVSLQDIPPQLFYLPIHPDQRSAMVGEIVLLCGVRADGYLGLCSLDRPLEDSVAQKAMGNRAKAVAANLRVRTTADDGSPTADHFVRLTVAFDGATSVSPDPFFELPRVLSRPDPGRMSDLYPIGAREQGLHGSAEVECISPARTGPLENCTLISEEPANHGFGPPTVAIAETVVASPFQIGGRPWRQVVRQRISWRTD